MKFPIKHFQRLSDLAFATVDQALGAFDMRGFRVGVSSADMCGGCHSGSPLNFINFPHRECFLVTSPVHDTDVGRPGKLSL